MNAAALTGLSLRDLEERTPARLHVWVAGVVLEELEAGRIVKSPDGLLRLRREMFDDRTLAALRGWESPT